MKHILDYDCRIPLNARNMQKGNVLFLVLLAIALFAALSYAVTKSISGGGQGVTTEKADTAISEIMQYAASLRASMLRMQVSGIPLEQLDFYTTARLNYDGSSSSDNNPACATTSCEIFSPQGGNNIYQAFEKYASLQSSAGIKSGHTQTRLLCTKNVGTTLPDIVLLVLNVDESICKAANKQSGIGDLILSAEPTFTSVAYRGATLATELNTTCANAFGDTVTQVQGKDMYCYVETSGDRRSLIVNLIER